MPLSSQIKFSLKVLLGLVVCLPVWLFAQNSEITVGGKKEVFAKTLADFVYKPPDGIIKPENLKAKLCYYNKGYLTKTISLKKIDDGYIFSFAIPDSVDIIVAGILNGNGEVFDNNMDKGFIIYTLDKNGRKFSSAGITKANLLNGFASYYLQLKYENPELLKTYETEFLQQPRLKQGDNYLSYLYLLYNAYPKKATGPLLSFAVQKENKSTDEAGLLQAVRIYKFLKKEKENKRLEDKIIYKYPKGELAKRKFWATYFAAEQRADSAVNAGETEYRQQFGDIEPEARDRFLMDIISNSASENDSARIEKNEPLIYNMTGLASMYNNLAWDIVNKPAATEKLNMARFLSGHSLRFINYRIANPLPDDDRENLLLLLDTYMDTYALILFRNGEYDSAFFYQDSILKRGSMSIEGKERYALFAEKAKGALFTKQFIEAELRKGEISAAMLTQLQNIYKQLNIADEAYVKIKYEADIRKRKSMAKLVNEKFGSTPPQSFKLKNLQGKEVSLASFKNKVVVLDFWATWCGPCRASFPAAQEIIQQYKKDMEVVFLFIDTWENNNFLDIQKKTGEFIKKNKYDFTVLIDVKNEVAAAFKVDAIPATFILDKKGNIAYMGGPSENLNSEIDAIKAYR